MSSLQPSDPNFTLAVLEDHTNDEPADVINSIVCIDSTTRALTTLASGKDFYSQPRFSADGSQILWQQWSHPYMPWESTELFIADFSAGEAAQSRKIAGTLDGSESISQAAFLPDGSVAFISDRSGFGELYQWKPQTSAITLLLKDEGRDIGAPAWQFGNSDWTILDSDRICVVTSGGTLCIVSVSKAATLQKLSTPFSAIRSLEAVSSTSVFCHGACELS